jgi:hypothetical protein
MLTELTSLTTGPVLRTRSGVRARIRCLSVRQLMALTSHFGCDVRGLERRLHRPRRWKPKRKCEQLTLFNDWGRKMTRATVKRPRTCEWCLAWRAMIGAFGRVTVVCQCKESPRHLILTGAGETCNEWTPRKESDGNE